MDSYQQYQYYISCLELRLNNILTIPFFNLINEFKNHKDKSFSGPNTKLLKLIIRNIIKKPLINDIKYNRKFYDTFYQSVKSIYSELFNNKIDNDMLNNIVNLSEHYTFLLTQNYLFKCITLSNCFEFKKMIINNTINDLFNPKNIQELKLITAKTYEKESKKTKERNIESRIRSERDESNTDTENKSFNDRSETKGSTNLLDRTKSLIDTNTLNDNNNNVIDFKEIGMVSTNSE